MKGGLAVSEFETIFVPGGDAAPSRCRPRAARFALSFMNYRWKIFTLVLLLGCTSVVAKNSSPLSPEMKEIRAVLEAQATAWNRGDLDGYMNGYAHDRATEMISGDRMTRGWKGIRSSYRKKFRSRQLMGHVSFPDVRITVLSSDSATAVGQWRIRRASGELHGTFSLLLRHRPEGWRIVRDYTTTIVP